MHYEDTTPYLADIRPAGGYSVALVGLDTVDGDVERLIVPLLGWGIVKRAVTVQDAYAPDATWISEVYPVILWCGETEFLDDAPEQRMGGFRRLAWEILPEGQEPRWDGLEMAVGR